MEFQTAESFYTSLSHNLIDGLAYCQMLYDKQGNPVDYIYLHTNKYFGQLTGLKDVEGKKATEIIPRIAISNSELFQSYARVALTGEPERLESYVGPLLQWFLVSVYSPQNGFVVVVFQNITVRKQVEKELGDAMIAARNVLEDLSEEKARAEALASDLEKYKLAVDNASDQILISDPEGIVIYGNSQIEKNTGYKLKDVVGKKAGILWKKPMPVEYYKKMWNTIKTKKKRFIDEIQNKRKNGEIYTSKISISPILDSHGNIQYFVSIERDITKEKEIDKAKTEFISIASHQLRTPLSAVNWYTEMLLTGDVGRLQLKQQQYLEVVHHSNQRMIGLVNRLLSVSRIELGTFVADPEAVDVKKLMEQAIDDALPQFKNKKLFLKKKYGRNIPILQADPKLLLIIFQNLISNSVEYTPDQGSINVSLSLDQQQKSLMVSVADTGYGIPANQQDMIFTKLFRADNVRVKDTKGTGLGLYIVKSIVVQTGGKIWFESEENVGTTFYVDLPIKEMSKKKSAKTIS